MLTSAALALPSERWGDCTHAELERGSAGCERVQHLDRRQRVEERMNLVVDRRPGLAVVCGVGCHARMLPQIARPRTRGTRGQLAAVTAKIVWPSRTYVEPGSAFAARLPVAASSASAA